MKGLKDWQKIYLRLNYKKHSNQELADYLQVKYKQVDSFLYKRRLVRVRNWSQFEVNILRLFGPKKASTIINRNLNSCTIKYHRLCKNTNSIEN